MRCFAKGQILWEGQNVWKNHRFLKLLSTDKTTWEIFSNLCGLLRISELYFHAPTLSQDINRTISIPACEKWEYALLQNSISTHYDISWPFVKVGRFAKYLWNPTYSAHYKWILGIGLKQHDFSKYCNECGHQFSCFKQVKNYHTQPWKQASLKARNLKV